MEETTTIINLLTNENGQKFVTIIALLYIIPKIWKFAKDHINGRIRDNKENTTQRERVIDKHLEDLKENIKDLRGELLRCQLETKNILLDIARTIENKSKNSN